MNTRPPAVAGVFYPAAPTVLSGLVERLLSAAPACGDLARAYVVPHAGYRYSGPTAAHVYARLRANRAAVGALRRIVLIGPSHRVRLRGAAVSPASHWRTPLGEVAVDVDASATLAASGVARFAGEPHAPEHSLEVQVPFLQCALGDALPPILPICVGPSTSDRLLAMAVDNGPALVLCSTDLSHYLTEAEAKERDATTAEAIEALAPERIGDRDACGSHALRALLTWAARAAPRVDRLHLSTSADTAGSPDRVVGYSAFALS